MDTDLGHSLSYASFLLDEGGQLPDQSVTLTLTNFAGVTTDEFVGLLTQGEYDDNADLTYQFLLDSSLIY